MPGKRKQKEKKAWEVIEKADRGATRFKHYHTHKREDFIDLFDNVPSWWVPEDIITLEHEVVCTAFGYKIVICKECKKIWLFKIKKKS